MPEHSCFSCLSFSAYAGMYMRDALDSARRNLTVPFMQPFIAQWRPLLLRGQSAAPTASVINSDRARRTTREIKASRSGRDGRDENVLRNLRKVAHVLGALVKHWCRRELNLKTSCLQNPPDSGISIIKGFPRQHFVRGTSANFSLGFSRAIM